MRGFGPATPASPTQWGATVSQLMMTGAPPLPVDPALAPPAPKELTFAFRVRRGHGFDGQRDGLCCRNVLACYTHVHALGTASWAPSIIRAAVRYGSHD